MGKTKENLQRETWFLSGQWADSNDVSHTHLRPPPLLLSLYVPVWVSLDEDRYSSLSYGYKYVRSL